MTKPTDASADTHDWLRIWYQQALKDAHVKSHYWHVLYLAVLALAGLVALGEIVQSILYLLVGATLITAYAVLEVREMSIQRDHAIRTALYIHSKLRNAGINIPDIVGGPMSRWEARRQKRTLFKRLDGDALVVISMLIMAFAIGLQALTKQLQSSSEVSPPAVATTPATQER